MRPSSIDKLDKAVKGEINRLRIDHGYTIEQIVEYLAKMDVNISKSAMGRHVKKIDVVTRRIMESRAVAEGIAPVVDGKDDGQLVAMNVELLHSIILQIMSATEDGDDVKFTASQAESLANALRSAASAAKINADRVLKIRQETAKTAVKEVDKVLKKSAPGLSAETVADIRRAVLGVAA